MNASQIHTHVQDKKVPEGYTYFIRYVVNDGEVLIRPLTHWDKVRELNPTSIHPFAWVGRTVQHSQRYYYQNLWLRFPAWADEEEWD